MAREDFSHIKPLVQSGGGAVQLMDQAWGDPVSGVELANAPGNNIQPAGLYSTAPYIAPLPKDLPVEERLRCLGKKGTCTNSNKLRPNGLCPGCDIQRIKRDKRLAEIAGWSMDSEG